MKKEQRKNRTGWYFADKKTPICRQTWEIGQAYYLKMQATAGKPSHHIKHTAKLTKLFYWIYLTCSLPNEAFQLPLTLEIDGSYMNIRHKNSKHKGQKAEIVMAMPIQDEYERLMWNFITDNGTTTEAKHIFGYGQWKSTKPNNLSALLTKNFITNLEDPSKKVHKNQGITAMLLRYMRFKNLMLEHNTPDRVLEIYFGCNIKELRSKHTELNKMLDLKEQKQLLEKPNVIPSLKLGYNTTY